MRERERKRDGGREREGGREGNRGMKGVCVTVYMYMCVRVWGGGREGRKKYRGKEGEREVCKVCVYVCMCVRVWGRGGREGEV